MWIVNQMKAFVVILFMKSLVRKEQLLEQGGQEPWMCLAQNRHKRLLSASNAYQES